MNCPMMRTTSSPTVLVYASMTNQSPENTLTRRTKVALTQTGISQTGIQSSPAKT